ncbi:MAG: hypothetical protein ACK5YW_05000 [Betaproteobacteria bacterium]|jgi:hypothetical protein|nr:hypothetical protein [Rhodocyclaceae bacterium]MCA3135238.1 hypothetical protein [Rhodocyclaceae bacterium]MCA3142737.1 hypothetical protein [Rhodocyclaceae bacterium]MCA3145270.1 hypothetical protein [Rhodocyclaceae bacterium]MCE2899386.1 hypothetical protein [Betaproteobacteria bacterium]
MRAIRKTIDGVTYDTGAAQRVQHAWERGPEGSPQAELTLFRGDGGHWFELRREADQLYGALRPLSAAQAAHWISRHAEPVPAAPPGRAETGGVPLPSRWSAPGPVGG